MTWLPILSLKSASVSTNFAPWFFTKSKRSTVELAREAVVEALGVQPAITMAKNVSQSVQPWETNQFWRVGGGQWAMAGNRQWQKALPTNNGKRQWQHALAISDGNEKWHMDNSTT